MVQDTLQLCLITEEFPAQNDAGGIGYHFFLIGKEFTRKGHKVVVIYNGAQHFFVGGMEVVGIWNNSPSYLQNIYTFLKRFELFKVLLWWWQAQRVVNRLEKNGAKFDLIETHDYHLTPGIFSLGSERIIISVHGGKKQTALLNDEFNFLKNRILSLLEHFALKRARNLYAVSSLQVKRTKDLHEVAVRTIIPNPVDTSFFSPLKKTKVIKKNHPYILYVGRFEKRKGVQQLVEAYSELATSKQSKDLPHLYFVGEECWQFGPYGDLSLREFIETLPDSVKNRMKLFPYLSQKKLLEFYQNALCCVCPSLEEPFGYVVTEAMSCEQLVVVSNTTGISSWLKNEEDSLVITLTAENLKRILKKIVSKHSGYKNLKKRARLTVKKYFQPSVVANQVEQYYRSILHQPGS